MPLSSLAPPFFVRASAIQSGYGIKNQKVSLSKRHPGWCTLMSPLKFEIHMLSHLILVPLSHSRSLLAFFFLSFFISPPSFCQVPSCTIQLGRAKEKNVRSFVKKKRSSLSPFFYSLCFYLVKKAGSNNESFNFPLIVGAGVRGFGGRRQGVREHRMGWRCAGRPLWCDFRAPKSKSMVATSHHTDSDRHTRFLA